MANKLNISRNKTLKLNNVLIRKIQEEEYSEFEKIVGFMENYIKSKGHQPIGPLIQHTSVMVNNEGDLNMQLTLLRQSDNYITHTEPPYIMDSILRVKNCLYVRFNDEESKLKFAYDKLGVFAYEEDLNLKGGNYTVFVDNDDTRLTADIFMECLTND